MSLSKLRNKTAKTPAKDDRLNIFQPDEDVVEMCRELSAAAKAKKDATERYEEAAADLKEAAHDYRDARDGYFPTVEIFFSEENGADRKAQVQFKQFSALSEKTQKRIPELLAEGPAGRSLFHELFTTTRTLSVSKRVADDDEACERLAVKLMEALGDEFDEVFELTEKVVPVADFDRIQFEQLDPETRQDLRAAGLKQTIAPIVRKA